MGQIVSDNFNRANAATLGANWTALTNTGSVSDIPIVSNQASSPLLSIGDPNAIDGFEFYSGAAWTPGSVGDQYAECQVTSVDAFGDAAGPCVRMSNPGNGRNGYVVEVNGLGSSVAHLLRKYVADAGTTLGTWTGTIQSTDVVRCAAQGTTISMLVNGVSQISVTDSAFSVGYPGLTVQQSGVGSSSAADNWAAGDFSVAGAGLFMPANLVTGAGGPFFPNPVT